MAERGIAGGVGVIDRRALLGGLIAVPALVDAQSFRRGRAPGFQAGLRFLTGGGLTPYPDGMFEHYDGNSVAPGAVTTWTGTIRGIPFVSGGAGGTRSANPLGTGKQAGVTFSGSNLVGSRSGAASSLAAVLDSQKYTVYCVITGVAASANACVIGALSANGSSDRFFATADGSVIGQFDGQSTGQTVPFTGTGPIAFGFSSTTDLSGGAGTGLRRIYTNGCCTSANVSPIPVPTGDIIIADLVAGGGLPFKGTICHIFIYDRELSPVAMLQLEKAWRDRAGLAYPWSGGEFLMFLGDSQTMGTGTDNGNNSLYNQGSYPYQMAQRRGRAYGQWSNLGIGGIAIDTPTQPSAGPQMQGRLPKDVYGTAALLGFAPKYLFGEWRNMHNAGVPGATGAGYARTYMQSLKNESPGSKIALWTSFTDSGEASGTIAADRSAYNSSIVSSHASADVFYPVHNDTNLGVAGACPSGGANTYFADGVHLTGKAGYPGTASGYPYFADQFQQVLSAAGF